MKNLLKISTIGLFIYTIVACTNDDSSKNELNREKVTQNVKQYSEDFLYLTNEIDKEFGKNHSKISKNSDLKNNLLSAKTENEVISIMISAGISNYETIVMLVNKRVLLQNNFRKQNPDFYLLDINERSELVNTQYDIVLENYLATKLSNTNKKSCASTYNTSIGRCNRSFGKCAITAVIAAAEGILPGLAVGVFCAWDLSDCKSDALEDYEDCQG